MYIRITVFNIIMEPVIKCRAKGREGSLSYLKSYPRNVKPTNMTCLSVCDLSVVRKSLTEVLRLEVLKSVDLAK